MQECEWILYFCDLLRVVELRNKDFMSTARKEIKYSTGEEACSKCNPKSVFFQE